MSTEELLHQVGEFEPADAKKILLAFEAENIPFEVESDHSALQEPGRWVQQYLGMYPEGSKLIVFVPESALPKAEIIMEEVLPIL